MVGTDEADIRLRAGLFMRSPQPVPDWAWQGEPVGDAARGSRGPGSGASMSILHRCFLGTFIAGVRAAAPELDLGMVVEDAAPAWVARCDAALAWADAPEEPTTVPSVDTQITGRLVGDLHVSSLKTLAAALKAEVSFDKTHEIVTITRGDREITLYVGLRQIDTEEETSELAFPSLQIAVDDLIVDTFGVAEALGLGEEVRER